MPDFVDDSFFGLNTAAPPEKLTPGLLTEATNVLVVGGGGGKGGYLQSRPGKRAQLTTPIGSSPYFPLTLVASDGTSWAMMIAGSTTTAQLYRWAKGANSVTFLCFNGTLYQWRSAAGGGYTAVLFNGPASQIAQSGNYFFVIGAIDGFMRRVKNDWTVDNGAGLLVPLYTPKASLTNIPLAAFGSGTVGYDTINTGGYASGIGDLHTTAAPFTGGNNAAAYNPVGWSPVGVMDSWQNIDSFKPTDWYVKMDDAGSYIQSLNAIPNLIKSNSAGHGTGATSLYATMLNFTCTYKADFADDSIIVTVFAYSDVGATAQIGQLAQTIKTTTYGVGPVGPITIQNLVFSFTGILGDTQIKSWRVRIDAGPNNHAGTNGPYISYIVAIPYLPLPTFNNNAVGKQISVPAMTVSQAGNFIYIGGQHFTYDQGATQDISIYQKLALRLDLAAYLATTPQIFLGFRTTSGGTTVYTDASGDLTTINGATYLTWDISTMTPSTINAVRFFELHVTGDLQEANNAVYDGTNFMTIGELSIGGNLTVGIADYSWRVTEVNAAGTIESQASPISDVLTPTAFQDMANVLLDSTAGVPAVPRNSGAYLKFWRRGGVYDDGLFRLVATVTTPAAPQSGDGWSWTVVGTGGNFLDNVPDSALEDADTLLDHESAPINGVAIGIFAERLFIATIDTLYQSQVILGANSPSAGLYWNSQNVPPDPTHPDAATQGNFYPLSEPLAEGSGPPVRLVPFLNRLFLMHLTARYTMSGTDNSNFSLRRWQVDEGKGLISPFASVVNNSALVFLASDGVRAMDGDTADVRLTNPIYPSIIPASYAFTAPALNATGFGRSVLFNHAGRLFLSVPSGSSGALNSDVYVLDDTTNSWVRWNLGSITGGMTFNGPSDTDDLFVTDATGQIYSISGSNFGDTATLGGGVTAVAVAVTTRAYTPASATADTIMATRFSCALSCGDTPTTVTMKVFDMDDPSGHKSWSQAYQFTGEKSIKRVRVQSQLARGRRLKARLTASSLTPFLIRLIQSETTEIVGTALG